MEGGRGLGQGRVGWLFASPTLRWIDGVGVIHLLGGGKAHDDLVIEALDCLRRVRALLLLREAVM